MGARPMMWALFAKEGKIQEGKTPLNIIVHENGLVQKKVEWMDYLNMCLPKNGWLTNIPKGNYGWRKGELMGIERPNKRENLRQLASYHTKLLKDGFPINGVEAFATSIYSTTQLGWTFKTIQTPWTITSHPPFIITPNWWNDKWMQKISQNYMHKVLLTNQYKTSPAIINRMPP